MPYRFIGKKVKLLYSRSLVEVFYHYERIALHRRTKRPYNYSTDNELATIDWRLSIGRFK